MAYFIACMFAEIFGMSIETILMCYIADEEMFPPAERFADGALKSAIQTTAQAAASAKVVADHAEVSVSYCVFLEWMVIYIVYCVQEGKGAQAVAIEDKGGFIL